MQTYLQQKTNLGVASFYKILGVSLFCLVFLTSLIFKPIILEISEYSVGYAFFINLPLLLLILLTAGAAGANKQWRWLFVVPFYTFAGILFSIVGYILSLMCTYVILANLGKVFTVNTESIFFHLYFWILIFVIPLATSVMGVSFLGKILRSKVGTTDKNLLLAAGCAAQMFAFAFWAAYSHWWFVN